MRKKESKEMEQFFCKNISRSSGASRPSLAFFRKCLKEVQGCPGLDGWSADETAVIAGCRLAARMAWQEMLRWEEMEGTPSSMKDCLLLHIPKPNKIEGGVGRTKDFRPLSILPIFWRAWSASWSKSSTMREFWRKHLPRGLSSAAEGGLGTECLVALLDHELNRLKFGVTLDYSFCFDTIDLSIIRQSLPSALPASMQPWIVLLISQWSQLTKWISINGHVEKKYLTGGTGIPQGDAASPLILSIFLWQGYEMVGDMLKKNGQALSLVYMDDRTIIADSPDVIAQAVVIWKTKRRLSGAVWCILYLLDTNLLWKCWGLSLAASLIWTRSFRRSNGKGYRRLDSVWTESPFCLRLSGRSWMTFCSLSAGLIAMVGWLIVPIQRCKSSFFRKPSMLSAN